MRLAHHSSISRLIIGMLFSQKVMFLAIWLFNRQSNHSQVGPYIAYIKVLHHMIDHMTTSHDYIFFFQAYSIYMFRCILQKSKKHTWKHQINRTTNWWTNEHIILQQIMTILHPNRISQKKWPLYIIKEKQNITKKFIKPFKNIKEKGKCHSFH